MDAELESLLALGRLLRRRREGGVRIAASLLRVRDREGRLRRLVANEAQQAFEATRGQHNIVLKARQMGMTTWVAGRFFLLTITRRGVLTVQVAQTRRAAETIFGIVQRMWENLPRALREGPLVRSRANSGQMVFPALDSEFRVWSAGDENAGRGMSIQNLHCSEVSRWPGDAAATLAGLRAALVSGGEMVLESTPNGAYGAFYSEWLRGVNALSMKDCASPHLRSEMWGTQASSTAGFVEPLEAPGASDGADPKGDTPPFRTDRERMGHSAELGNAEFSLVRHFLPWWMESTYASEAVPAEAMSAEELALVAAHGLSAEQIGFRRGLERSFGGLRAQEFAEDAESCFRATGDCCFDVGAIERRMSELDGAPASPAREAGSVASLRMTDRKASAEATTSRASAWACERRNGSLLVWFGALVGREYIVAVDTAGGGADGDFAAIQVLDAATGMQCAELQERLAPLDLACVAADLAREYGGAMVVVERNNHGSAVLAYLSTVAKYERVYQQAGQAGWLTTTASKPAMVSGLGALLVERPEIFFSQRLLAECRTFVRGEYGRTGAGGSGHDDLVMSMAMGQAVRMQTVVGRQ